MLRRCLIFGKTKRLPSIKESLTSDEISSRTHTNTSSPMESKSDAYTSISECGGTRIITLNNVRTRNALSMPMMNSILDGITHGWGESSLRCIVLNANGPVWSSGHDLKELAAVSKGKQLEIFDKLTEIILNIQEAPVPIIGTINGIAAAAGCQLLCSCDIIVATDKSSFSTPGSKFGIFCSTPGVALARSMDSRSKAAYMLMTSLPITAKEAHESGLITRLVSSTEIDHELGNIIQAIKSQSRAVLAHGKKFFYKQICMTDLEKAYVAGSEVMVENLQLEDGKEGLRSFAEKRKPEWKHK